MVYNVKNIKDKGRVQIDDWGQEWVMKDEELNIKIETGRVVMVTIWQYDISARPYEKRKTTVWEDNWRAWELYGRPFYMSKRGRVVKFEL